MGFAREARASEEKGKRDSFMSFHGGAVCLVFGKGCCGWCGGWSSGSNNVVSLWQHGPPGAARRAPNALLFIAVCVIGKR